MKLAFTGLAGFTLACVVIETAGTFIGTAIAGSSDGQNYLVTRTIVELLLALYVADFVTGLIHMLLDFQTVHDCVESTSASGAPDNSSLSHFSAMTRPTWLGRAARNRHRHAIKQASRRWRGGRRDDSARTRRKILIFHTGPRAELRRGRNHRRFSRYVIGSETLGYS